MLRIFLTVSVLFWNQLAAQDPAEEVMNVCTEDDCILPAVVIKDKQCKHEQGQRLVIQPKSRSTSGADSGGILRSFAGGDLLQNYIEMEYRFHRRVETEVHAVNFQSAIEIGLEKLFNYSRCGNVAGTVVPISAPWGVFGYLENGKIQQRFRVYLEILPEVINPPEPTDPTVETVFTPPVWFFARAFNKKVDEQQIEERVTQLLKDLEQDNQPLKPTFFLIAFYNTHGLMGIAFEKAGE
ncbi:uncharacterized protein LOC119966787 isoform X1 [Scyliorhinus canicula]|uniref:uncharacterized protein LOC119966787 isoform X1 n=1 Tax=Scyliorhinus canicula TaxID=7830 RepID=UPI0018F535B7|nr:uncharacterized protein LOC119966787 isoform X1 [Scyliorhinus canicula]